MADFSALPLFTDAFLADTSHLSDAECGLYLRLLMTIWRSPGCRVPNDEAWLAKRFQRSVEACRIEVIPLVKEFCNSDGNWITQKRLSREFEYVKSHSKKQSDRAKSRWERDKNHAGGYAEPHAPGNAPTPTPTPTQENLSSLVVGSKDEIKKERTVLGNLDFASDDGSVIITAEEFSQIEADCPSIKNVRGLARHACRSWLETIPADDRKAALLRWFKKKQTETAAKVPKASAPENFVHGSRKYSTPETTAEYDRRQAESAKAREVRERHARLREARNGQPPR